MGHQLLYGFCRKCGKMWGKRNGKSVFNDCKCSVMNTCKSGYMCEEEIQSIEKILTSDNFDDGQKAYWKAKILTRVNELKPLIAECIEKDVSLQNLDNDINNEWNQLIILRNKYCL